MGAAAANVAVQRSFDIGDAGMRVLIEQGFGAHDHAVHAVAALRGLLFDESSLDRVRMRGRSPNLRVW